MAKSDHIKPVPSRELANVPAKETETASERPSTKVIAFVKKHPVLMVAGAVAAGVAVSAMLPRKTSRRFLGKALHLAEATGAAGMIFGREAKDAGKQLGRNARRQASWLGHRAESAGGATAAQLEKFGVAALAAASALGRSTTERAGKLGDAAEDTASRIGDVAAARSRKIGSALSDIRGRLKH